MATLPTYAATPVAWAGLVPATLDTSLTAPTNVTTLGTAGTSGTKIEEIVCQGVGTTVTGIVNVFLHDGSTYHLYDQFFISPFTSSTTTLAYRFTKYYTNLVLPTSAWSLRVTNTIAGNQSLLKLTAIGASF
jgi:hypothetical protein